MERKDDVLLANLKSKLPELEKLLAQVNNEWAYEDLVYRYFHYSYKVYHAQDYTKEIIDILQSLMPNVKLNEDFIKIINEGTSKRFDMSHNKEWARHTRLMLEAFFYAKYMLEMAIKYGKKLETAPNMLPSGWAGLLSLFNMR